VRTLNDIATDGVKPDLIIGFKIKKEDYIKRKRKTADRIEQDDAFGEIVFSAYEKIYLSRNDIFVVDGSLSIDEIHEIIKKEVLKLINVF
jgi:dTMP kinase